MDRSSRINRTSRDSWQIRSRSRWFVASILLLVALFVAAMVERDRIRAHWWSWRLTRTHRPAELAYYASSLAAVGDAALGATRGLARAGRADVRSIAVAVLGHLPVPDAVPILATLLADPDPDVRASAALSLAFFRDPQAEAALMQSALSNNAKVAAAATAALGRLQAPAARNRLCRVLRNHPDSFVRAQAAETLGEAIDAGSPTTHPALRSSDADVIRELVHALVDDEPFTGRLATERQIDAITAEVSATTTLPVEVPAKASEQTSRTVAWIAARSIRNLTGVRADMTIRRSSADESALAKRLTQSLSEPTITQPAP
ncbi:MAG: HEAT repeat domain-containing protein [Phycisphaerae bacterium]